MKVRQLIGLLLVITFLSTTLPVAALPPLDPQLPTIPTEASTTAADGLQVEVLAGWVAK